MSDQESFAVATAALSNELNALVASVRTGFNSIRSDMHCTRDPARAAVAFKSRLEQMEAECSDQERYVAALHRVTADKIRFSESLGYLTALRDSDREHAELVMARLQQYGYRPPEDAALASSDCSASDVQHMEAFHVAAEAKAVRCEEVRDVHGGSLFKAAMARIGSRKEVLFLTGLTSSGTECGDACVVQILFKLG